MKRRSSSKTPETAPPEEYTIVDLGLMFQTPQDILDLPASEPQTTTDPELDNLYMDYVQGKMDISDLLKSRASTDFADSGPGTSNRRSSLRRSARVPKLVQPKIKWYESEDSELDSGSSPKGNKRKRRKSNSSNESFRLAENEQANDSYSEEGDESVEEESGEDYRDDRGMDDEDFNIFSDTENFNFDEFLADDDLSTIHPKDLCKVKAARVQLSKELRQYLGEAERLLNLDQFKEAEEICRTIISQTPTAPEPYMVLAEIFYRQTQIQRAREYLIMAANRRPTDFNMWLSVYRMCEELKDEPASLFYLNKACVISKYDPHLVDQLLELLEKRGMHQQAARSRLFALRANPLKDEQQLLQKCQEMFNSYMANGETHWALRALDIFFTNFPQSGTQNMRYDYLKMLIENERFDDAVKFAMNCCQLRLYSNKGNLIKPVRSRYADLKNTCSQDIPADFADQETPLAIQLRCCAVIVRYGVTNPVMDLLQSIITKVADFEGDSGTDEWQSRSLLIDECLNVAMVSITQKEFTLADSILQRLIEIDLSTTEKKAKAWRMIAVCQCESGRLEQAIESFQYVIRELDSHDLQARLALGTLLRKFNRNVEALEVLKPSEEFRPSVALPKIGFQMELANPEPRRMLLDDPSALRIAYERCCMFSADPSETNTFLDECWNLLFGDIVHTIGSEGSQKILDLDNVSKGQEILRKKCPSLYKLMESTSRGVTAENLWDLFLKMTEVLRERRDHEKIETAASLMMLMPFVVSDEDRKKTAQDLLIHSALLLGHDEIAFDQLKFFYNTWKHSNMYWYFFNQSIPNHKGSKFTRILRRLHSNKKTAPPYQLALALVNVLITRGSIRYAIASLACLRQQYGPSDYVSLCLGSLFISIAMQRFILARHAPVLQAFAFFNEYRRLRGDCAEVHFNFGRACQQLGLNSHAVWFYEQALAKPALGDTPEEREALDIRFKAAYNLFRLYMSIEARTKAYHVLHTYLVL